MIETEPFDLNLIASNELFAITYDSKDMNNAYVEKLKSNNKHMIHIFV